MPIDISEYVKSIKTSDWNVSKESFPILFWNLLKKFFPLLNINKKNKETIFHRFILTV